MQEVIVIDNSVVMSWCFEDEATINMPMMSWIHCSISVLLSLVSGLSK